MSHGIEGSPVLDQARGGGWLPVVSVAAVFGGLYLLTLYNYLLFHSIAEIFSIVIAWGIFVIAWNSRGFAAHPYLLFIGIAYLFIGGIDLIHALAYRGMGVLAGGNVNLPTQLWIAARYLQGFTLLLAPSFLGRKVSHVRVFAGYALAFAILLASIFSA